ncbi:MAG: hypothetical protein PHG65_06520, partial [Kiritimatiellae bacterium]|nr:hypothetical protein [Kiritimatiellia bacterium]
MDKNTFFGNTTVFSAFDGQIRNSVINGGILSEDGQPSALSDYNVLYDVDIPGYRSLREYQKAVGGWWHSSVADPLFADAANGDFHPKSQKGRWDPAALSWAYDPVTSPLVDFGDPAADYANETPPNGSNVNAGAYGNTWQASRTPTNARLLVLSLTDGGTLEVPGDKVYWRAYNLPPGATVRIELSQDSGNTWLPVVTNISALAGEYAWMNTNYPSTFEARWRVVYEADTGVSDATDADFAFHNGPYTYYLNDSTLDNDVYCTAEGNDGNSGTRDDEPMYSLKALLDAYELVPGDIIYVDTGHYVQSANATFTALDSGSTNEPIHVIGSPQGTVFDRGSSSATAYGLSFNGAKHVDVSYLMVSGGGVGYQLNSATGIVLRHCAAQNEAYDGIASTNSYLDVMNGVFWANTGAAVRVSSGHVSVTNSILGAFGSAAYGYYVSSTNVLSANYNDIYTSDEGVAGYVVSLQRNLDSLSVWSKLTGLDTFSLSVDPQFASATNSDFHLKTEVENGRYVWGGDYSAEDAVTSPLIDAGDPASDFTNEPNYNGGRINMGMWGNTAQASKREQVDLALEAGSPSGGGGLSGNGAFHWVAYGDNRGVETVKIEFSGDAGRTWQQIASGVPATDERYVWDTTLVSNTPAALWQVIGESDTNISSAVSNFFGIRNAPLTWYVNDGNLVGDMYCSAVGNATNWPATADAPLDSLAQVLAYYDVEPGDRIYVDTGVYTNEANVVIGRLAGGAVSSRVVIAGSTNLPAGGTQFIRSDSSSNNVGLTIASASYLSGSNLVLYAGYHGLLVSNAVGISWDGLTVMSNASDGVVVNVSSNVQLSRVLVSGGGGCGVQLSGSKAVRLERSILWSNALSAVVISNAQLSVRSSVLTVADYGYYLYQLIGAQSALDADQNDLILWGLAQAADVRGSRARTILDWQTKFTNDVRSLSHDPLFADYGLTGFHPCSQAGRYEPGTGSLTNDVVTSPLIDTGDPLAVYAAEPTPNGSRVNIGLYGNTAEASKSRTNGWYLALTCNDGGMLRGTNWIYWVAGGAATGDTVKLEYLDDGSNWVTFASGLPASPAEYQWNTTEPGIPLVINRTRWRVVSESDTNIVGETQNDFTLNNGKLTFYVNDSFTVDDVYCGVPGAAGNDGLTTNTPVNSVDAIVSRYDLYVGDRIFIDTGIYTQTVTISIDQVAGESTNRIELVGSTNGSVTYADGITAISLNDSSWVDVRDLSYRNASACLVATRSTNCAIQNVEAYGGVEGFRLLTGSREVRFDHCAAYGVTNRGVYNEGLNNQWNHGVIRSRQNAVVVESGTFGISNSVIVAGTNGYAYWLGNGASVSADYNGIDLSRQAKAGYAEDGVNDIIYENVSRWSWYTGQDKHSLADKPLFADEDNADLHLKTQLPNGRYVSGSGYVTNDAVTSPLLDAAARTSGFTNEPAPNGARANIGLYGNTVQASRTPTNSGWLAVISLNDGGFAKGLYELNWVAGGVATGLYGRIEFSGDGGLIWSNVASGVLLGDGAYSWNTATVPSTPLGYWRIFSTNGVAVSDTNEVFFAVRNSALNFYVNDLSTTGDVYTTTTGVSSATGAFSNAPKDSIAGILDRYDLEPGDTIYVDTGIYSNAAVISFGRFDAGAAGTPVVVQGSTNEIDGGTLLLNYGVRAEYADGISLRDLTFSNASTAVDFYYSDNSSATRVRALGAGTAFSIQRSDNVVLEQVLAASCSSRGLYANTCVGVTLRQSVLWSLSSAIELISTSLTLDNNLLRASGSSAFAYQYRGTRPTADYNGIYLENGAQAAFDQQNDVIYDSVGRWHWFSGQDAHSLSKNPLFADVSGGDFHLQTQYPTGRYVRAVGGYATNDTATSPLLDSGNPAVPVGSEPLPNGARVNIGLYGSSVQASKTATNAELTVLTLNDGGVIAGTDYLYWVAHGDATGHTVRIEYTGNGGQTWTNLTTGVPAALGYFQWNTTSFRSTPLGYWRIVSEMNSNVTAVNEQPFAV